ncbi:MAG: THUMP-like domain-containing protein [Phycisphaerae bacterium]
MALTTTDLEFLRSPDGQALLAIDLPDDPIAAVSRLRKKCGPAEASAVIQLTELRRRAEKSGRFPADLARKLFITDKLLQQASSYRLARYKADGLAACNPSTAHDLCCGAGLDALAMARGGLHVQAIDRSPLATLCTAVNAEAMDLTDRLEVVSADVTRTPLPGEGAVHIDPDRRAGSRRSTSLADAQPGVVFLARLMSETRAGVVKLSAAIDRGELSMLPAAGAEYVSEGGVCKQLLLWWGREDRPAGTAWATRVDGTFEKPVATSLAVGGAPPAGAGECGKYLIEPDPAVLAAEGTDDLAAAHDLWRIEPNHVWLTGDAPADTPLATSFELLAEVPGREKDVARALQKMDAGLVEVKTRGLRLDTDRLQKTLRGKGQSPLVVLWTRRGEKQVAMLARRLNPRNG